MSVSNGLYDNDFRTTGLYNLYRLPLTILATYLLVYWILPIYFKGRIAQALAGGLSVLVATILLDRLLIQHLLFPLFYGGSDYTFIYWDWYRLSSFCVHLLTTFGVMASFKYYRDWKRSQKYAEELVNEKRRAELQLLRAQIHPHFLFNALNAIYYETGKDSAKGQELILKFADFLRFTLQESKEEWISIAQEEKLICNYVDLQKSRFGARMEVQIDWEVTGTERLPPMICFFLVENAFKHGVLESGETTVMRIQMQRTNDFLEFTVDNPVPGEKAADPFLSREGIGLRNLRRQLELVYAGRSTYTHTLRDGRYFSTLQIPANP
jgi:sensor histidine kinase YesM